MKNITLATDMSMLSSAELAAAKKVAQLVINEASKRDAERKGNFTRQNRLQLAYGMSQNKMK